jgi:glycosyltransferase involved in cell wall biosynthesis
MTTDQSPKKIAINGRFLTQPITGVQRYAYELVRAWDVMLANGEIDSQRFQLELVTPQMETPMKEFQCIQVRQVGRLKGNLWEQIDLPWYTRGEFLFNPCNIGPLVKLNQAVTIHDASVFAVPESYSWAFRLKYGLIISVLAKTASMLFTVSQYSKEELNHYCNIPLNKLVVVYEGCDHIHRIIADQSVFHKYCIGDKPYVLAVGSNAPHKNFAILDEAASVLSSENLEIIIAGGDFKGWFNSVPDCTTHGARRLGYVTEEELRALYQRATAFIIPSYYEGFGLPPLEAMACGCPVIASRIASLPEICGDAAIYIDPDKPQDLADILLELMCDPSIKQSLGERGVLQANKFIWRSTAKMTWEMLNLTFKSPQVDTIMEKNP